MKYFLRALGTPTDVFVICVKMAIFKVADAASHSTRKSSLNFSDNFQIILTCRHGHIKLPGEAYNTPRKPSWKSNQRTEEFIRNGQ